MFPDLIQLMGVFLVPLTIVAIITYGILGLRRRNRSSIELDTGIGTVKRLYFYTVSLVALIMASSGVTELGHYVFDAITDIEIDGASRIRLATGLSLTIVGVPLWVFHWSLITKLIRELPIEKRSLIRKLYFYIILAISLGIFIGATITILQWLMNNRQFSGYSTAAIPVWAAVWVFHWRIESSEGQSTPETSSIRRLYIYIVATISLIAAATAIGVLFASLLNHIYDTLNSIESLVRPQFWNSSNKILLSLIVVMGTTWAGHWLYFARSDYDSILRQLYIYGVSILGSIVSVLVALGIVIYGTLVWVLGVPVDTEATIHFGFLPAALASVFVGSGVFAHHWYVAKREDAAAFKSSRRAPDSFPYVVAMIGLLILSVATVTAVSSSIGLLVDSAAISLSENTAWQNQIILVFTLGLLGAPLWSYCWFFHSQGRVKRDDLNIQSRKARRNFSLAVMGLGMVSLAVCISFSLFVLLRELLDGNISDVLPDIKTSLGVIIAASIFVPYHWMIYKKDRHVTHELKSPNEVTHIQKSILVLANSDGARFVSNLEAIMDCNIDILKWVDTDANFPKLKESETQKLAQDIRNASGPNILLIPDGLIIRILSYG